MVSKVADCLAQESLKRQSIRVVITLSTAAAAFEVVMRRNLKNAVDPASEHDLSTGALVVNEAVIIPIAMHCYKFVYDLLK